MDFKTREITLEAKGALYMKNKLQHGSQEVAKTVKNSTDYISNKAQKVEKKLVKLSIMSKKL